MDKTLEQKIEKWLEERFPNKHIFPASEPINNSIHCTDYDVDGVLVRGRHFSPHHRGDKSALMFYPVTDEQKEQLRLVEEHFATQKAAKQKRSQEAEKINRDRW